MLLPLAYFSFLINLLNLMPVSPLDGGRIVGAISRWIWPIGLALMGFAFLYTHSVLLLILLWLGFMETISRFRVMSAGGTYYRIPLLSRAYVTHLLLRAGRRPGDWHVRHRGANGSAGSRPSLFGG